MPKTHNLLSAEIYKAKVFFSVKKNRHLVRCGCGCGNQIEIYHSPDGTVEIGGVVIPKHQLVDLLVVGGNKE